MNKALILLVGIMIAMLIMPFPTVAAAEVDVDIDVEGCWIIENYCSNVIKFTIGLNQFENHYCYPTGDPSHIKVWSNQPYNLYIEHDNPSGWSGTGWQFWTRVGYEVPTDHSGSDVYEIKDTATALYWASNQPAVDEKNWYFYYLIDGIDYEDTWVAHTDMVLTYTLATSI